MPPAKVMITSNIPADACRKLAFLEIDSLFHLFSRTRLSWVAKINDEATNANAAPYWASDKPNKRCSTNGEPDR